jgi:hypothetical protein
VYSSAHAAGAGRQFLILGASLASAAPAADLTIDSAKPLGKIRALQGVWNGPFAYGENAKLEGYHAEAGFRDGSLDAKQVKLLSRLRLAIKELTANRKSRGWSLRAGNQAQMWHEFKSEAVERERALLRRGRCQGQAGQPLTEESHASGHLPLVQSVEQEWSLEPIGV